jgi:guanosine-3',5'-bis(diphosphate) 3'-pyrophosphohydrolase
MADSTLWVRAEKFATEKHDGQVRKGDPPEPYIKHPIAVARVLVDVGGITDEELLAAALLHDTVEDTKTTFEDLTREFGARVSSLVGEVTDDKSLDKEERKRLQIEHSANISPDAKTLKFGDKICNVRDVANKPPKDWSKTRRLEYLEWTEKVIAGCRGVNQQLEDLYDDELRKGQDLISGS